MKWIVFENAKLVLEAVAVFGILLLFWMHPAVKKAREKRAVRTVAYAAAFLFTVQGAAQILTRDQYRYPQTSEPFPFTRWAMFAGFTHSMDSGVLYDWRGLNGHGDGVYLNPAHLYITPNAVVLFTKTHSLGDQIFTRQEEPIEPSLIGALESFAEGIFVRHNLLHPHEPIVKVELWRRVLPLGQGDTVPEPFVSPQSELVYSYQGAGR